MYNCISSRRGWFRRLAAACLGLVAGPAFARDPDRPARGGARTTLKALDQIEYRQAVSNSLFAELQHGRTIAFTYDVSGKLTSVTEEPGTVTTFVYDGRGRVLSSVVAER